MFTPKDKNGKDIYIKAEVAFTTQDDMGADVEETGIIISCPKQDLVQVQPNRGGLPVLMDPATVEVTYCLVQEVLDLKGNEELEKILLDTEARYENAVAASKKPRKKSSGSGGSSPGKKTITFDLGV